MKKKTTVTAEAALLLRFRAPAHFQGRQSRMRARAAPDDREPLALVKAPRAAVRFVDVELDRPRRAALGLVKQRRGQARAALGRRDAELVEMAGNRIDGHEAGGLISCAKPDHDIGAVGAKAAQAIVDPGAARLEINGKARRAPGRGPHIDERRKIGLGEGAQHAGRGAHRSVSLSSMRRLRASASSSVPWSIGWNSPKPAAASRSGSTPLLIRYCTTETARAADNSQFDLYWPAPVIGRLSVCPSTRKIQGMSGGISRSRSSTAEASVSRDFCPAGLMSALPTSNSTEDSNTKRSPTTRMSG